MKALTDKDISEGEVFSLGQLESGYDAYNNIMLIIAAYVAKKRQNKELVNELIMKCSNNTYTGMWNRWDNKEEQ